MSLKPKIKVWKPKPVAKPVKKKTTNRKEYDNKWRKTSVVFRKKNVFCVKCLKEGIYTTENLEVDHIIPITENKDLKYNETNLQVLCKRHHSQKTYKETLSK